MSRIKDLKEQDANTINIVDIIEKTLDNNKSKYVELFLRLFKNKLEDIIRSSSSTIMDGLIIRNEKLKNPLETFVLDTIVRYFGHDEFIDFQKFCEYNEKNYIKQTDLSRYKKIEDINKQISIAELSLITKEMQKHVIYLLDNDEWVVLKPLTYESSVKYGYGTTWCTAAVKTSESFYRYANNGILIYCINKKTGVKVAVHKELGNSKSLSFWNQIDERVDSMDAEISDEVLVVVKENLKTCKLSNLMLLDKETLEKEMSKFNVWNGTSPTPNHNPDPPLGGIPVRNRFDDFIPPDIRA